MYQASGQGWYQGVVWHTKLHVLQRDEKTWRDLPGNMKSIVRATYGPRLRNASRFLSFWWRRLVLTDGEPRAVRVLRLLGWERLLSLLLGLRRAAVVRRVGVGWNRARPDERPRRRARRRRRRRRCERAKSRYGRRRRRGRRHGHGYGGERERRRDGRRGRGRGRRRRLLFLGRGSRR
jgi:hypothetical protein